MSKLIDLTGQRFGKLVVESQALSASYHSVRWNCKCDCGNMYVANGRSLRQGKVTDCGCETVRFYDLTGQRFGKLLVLEKTPTEPDKRTRLLCQCDCGNQYIATSQTLRKGQIKSCGCGRRKDIAGMHFGHLTAIERSEQYIIRENYGKRYMWKCICDCGAIVYRLPEN